MKITMQKKGTNEKGTSFLIDFREKKQSSTGEGQFPRRANDEIIYLEATKESGPFVGGRWRASEC